MFAFRIQTHRGDSFSSLCGNQNKQTVALAISRENKNVNKKGRFHEKIKMETNSADFTRRIEELLLAILKIRIYTKAAHH